MINKLIFCTAQNYLTSEKTNGTIFVLIIVVLTKFKLIISHKNEIMFVKCCLILFVLVNSIDYHGYVFNVDFYTYMYVVIESRLFAMLFSLSLLYLLLLMTIQYI